MKTIKILLFAALFAASFSACKRDDDALDRLPKETSAGKNTFGCKINGKVWVPEAGSLMGPSSKPLDISFSDDLSSAWVVTNNEKNGYHETMVMRLEGLLKKTAFRLDVKDKYVEGLERSSCLLRDYKASPSPEYHTSPTRTGWVEITRLDTVERIIAGRFEFSMQMEGGDSVLNVTDGRFDIKF